MQRMTLPTSGYVYTLIAKAGCCWVNTTKPQLSRACGGVLLAHTGLEQRRRADARQEFLIHIH